MTMADVIAIGADVIAHYIILFNCWLVLLPNGETGLMLLPLYYIVLLLADVIANSGSCYGHF